MDKNAIAKELIADGHSMFRMSSRLQASAKRLDGDVHKQIEQ